MGFGIVAPRSVSEEESWRDPSRLFDPSIVGLILPANKSVCQGVVNKVSTSVQFEFLVDPLPIRLNGSLGYFHFPGYLPRRKAQCNST